MNIGFIYDRYNGGRGHFFAHAPAERKRRRLLPQPFPNSDEYFGKTRCVAVESLDALHPAQRGSPPFRNAALPAWPLWEIARTEPEGLTAATTAPIFIHLKGNERSMGDEDARG